jgi:hypothetical protein
MLNTQSRLTALLVWLAIAAIAGHALWSFLALDTPAGLVRRFAESEFAAAVTRNQVLFTGLAGFGGLALAYLLNGWRDRAERRHAIERAEKRLGAVLAREATGLADALEAALKASAAGTPCARLAEIAEPRDSVLLSAPVHELSRLGPGAVGAVQVVRRGVRRLQALAEGRDEAQSRQLPADVISTALAARDAARVLGTLGARGPTAADRLRLVPPSESDVSDLARRLTDGTSVQRLLPAA